MNWETWGYFRWVYSHWPGLTHGKIYKITYNNGTFMHFFDDTGHTKQWYFPVMGVERVSFEENLEKILE